jgi:hypothetical protein
MPFYFVCHNTDGIRRALFMNPISSVSTSAYMKYHWMGKYQWKWPQLKFYAFMVWWLIKKWDSFNFMLNNVSVYDCGGKGGGGEELKLNCFYLYARSGMKPLIQWQGHGNVDYMHDIWRFAKIKLVKNNRKILYSTHFWIWRTIFAKYLVTNASNMDLVCSMKLGVEKIMYSDGPKIQTTDIKAWWTRQVSEKGMGISLILMFHPSLKMLYQPHIIYHYIKLINCQIFKQVSKYLQKFQNDSYTYGICINIASSIYHNLHLSEHCINWPLWSHLVFLLC